MKSIVVADFNRLLSSEPDVKVIDVRTRAEFAEVHVAQARSTPLDSLAPQTLVSSGLIVGDKPVYILCRSGARAAKAAEQFARDGFDNAVVVEGGTLAWIDAGLPVERGTSTVMSLERQVRIGAGSFVLTGVLLGWLVHPGFFGLSAFVGAGLVFAGITDWCGMGLLLAKAPWNQRA